MNILPAATAVTTDQESPQPSAVPTELTDTDRDNTRKLYKLMFDTVRELDGKLQIIAFDHADFTDDWFQESIIETWRGGEALIPHEWSQTTTTEQLALPEGDHENEVPTDN